MSSSCTHGSSQCHEPTATQNTTPNITFFRNSLHEFIYAFSPCFILVGIPDMPDHEAMELLHKADEGNASKLHLP